MKTRSLVQTTLLCSAVGLLLYASARTHAAAPEFTVLTVDTREEELQLHLHDPSGKPFRRLRSLALWLTAQQQPPRFVMNAGMYEPDLSPVGLFVANGRELKPLNLSSGEGNFYLKPNGVFLVTARGPAIVESSKYSAVKGPVHLATQSGPLLVERGRIHPAFRAGSRSRFIRNAVGVRGTTAVFVISRHPVNFHEMAVYMRDELGCDDALYLDGVVSSLVVDGTDRRNAGVDLGPMIAAIERSERR